MLKIQDKDLIIDLSTLIDTLGAAANKEIKRLDAEIARKIALNKSTPASGFARCVDTAAHLNSSNDAVVITKGYYSIGDGGAAAYFLQENSAEEPNGFTVFNCSAGGRYILMAQPIINSRVAGLIDSETENQYLKLKKFFTLGAGKRLEFAPGTIYTCGDSGFVVPPNTTVSGKGARLKIVSLSSSVGLDMQGNNEWSGVDVEYTQKSYPAFADERSTFRVGSYITGKGKNNVSIKDCSISAIGEIPYGMIGINVFGGSCMIKLENLIFPPTAASDCAIQAHWGTNFNIGFPSAQNPSTHPTNISIKNIIIGAMTSNVGDVVGIWCAGAIGVSIENVTIDDCRQAIVLTTGDYGYRYSGFPNKKENNTVYCKNIQAKKARLFGVRVVGYEENGTVSTSNIYTLENIDVSGPADETLNGSIISGIRLENTHGTRILNPSVRGFQYGASFGKDVQNTRISGGTFADNRINAIMCSQFAPFENTFIRGLFIKDVYFARNGWGTAGWLASAIHIDGGSLIQVANCLFGDTLTEDTAQEIAIYTKPPASLVSIYDNHCMSAKPGALDYLFFLGDDPYPGNLSTFRNNTADQKLSIQRIIKNN